MSDNSSRLVETKGENKLVGVGFDWIMRAGNFFYKHTNAACFLGGMIGSIGCNEAYPASYTNVFLVAGAMKYFTCGVPVMFKDPTLTPEQVKAKSLGACGGLLLLVAATVCGFVVAHDTGARFDAALGHANEAAARGTYTYQEKVTVRPVPFSSFGAYDVDYVAERTPSGRVFQTVNGSPIKAGL